LAGSADPPTARGIINAMTPLRIISLDDEAVSAVRTEEHPCSYLPGRAAAELIVVGASIDSARYQELMDRGFRRTGEFFYRPDCPSCRACEPIRVPVATFRPSRSQRRVIRRNRDVSVRIQPPALDDERWNVFRRYQAYQHDGSMCPTRADYEITYCASPIDTMEMSYWSHESPAAAGGAAVAGSRLVGIGIVDVTPAALSSVYFYFDPEYARRGLGVYSALCEIDECRRRGLPYWYAGYYVAGCRKMAYKSRFRPCELLRPNGTWAAGSRPSPTD
jgi:arginine-tRNA-protein transferase